MGRRIAVLIIGIIALSVSLGPSVVYAATPQTHTKRLCCWLKRTMEKDPERNDAFGVVMVTLRETCDEVLGMTPLDPEMCAELSGELGILREALKPIVVPLEDRVVAPALRRDARTLGGAVGAAAMLGASGVWHQPTYERVDKNYRRTLDLTEEG